MAGDHGSSAATATARPTRPAMAGRSSSMTHVHNHGNAASGAKPRDGRPPTRSYSHSHWHSQQHSRRSYHRRSHSHSEGELSKQPGCKQLTGETMGGLATASCLLPCAVVDFAFVATVRAPVALCRRAVRGSKQRRSASVGEAEMAKLREEADSVLKFGRTASAWPVMAPADEEEELEKKVWASFNDAGFGRTSPHLANDVS